METGARRRFEAPIGVRMSADRKPGAAEREVLARLRRYARLRAAERAVACAARFRDSLEVAVSARGVAERLLTQLECVRGESAAGEACASPETLELGAVDAALESYSSRLQEVIDRVSIARFRATLPVSAEMYREEVVALLDLCIEDSNLALRRRDLIDFLVTLLASLQQNGMRVVAADPSRLTRRFAAVCGAVERQAGDTEAEEERLREAVGNLLDLEDVEAVVQEIRAVKRSLGKRFFAPSVLRAVVAYNVAVANHFQSLLDAERAMDKEILSSLHTR